MAPLQGIGSKNKRIEFRVVLTIIANSEVDLESFMDQNERIVGTLWEEYHKGLKVICLKTKYFTDKTVSETSSQVNLLIHIGTTQ